ncbi:MAG: hypothetical protein ACK5N8_04010, partial [Alphaproteobacteria bacterium]
RQATIRKIIKSELCFVIMEEKTVNPKSSTIQLVYSSGGKTTKTCGKMFKYVAPTSLEYYREFSAETPAEEAKKALTKREIIKKDIDTQYNGAIAEFNKASKNISQINAAK